MWLSAGTALAGADLANLRVRVGPGRGSGTRQIEVKPRAPAPAAARPSAAAAPAPSPRREPERSTNATHKLGKPPKVPRATLPEDVPKKTIDDRLRRSIAGGATVDDLDQGSDDPELLELAKAERQLFPALGSNQVEDGARDLPTPLASFAPTVSASGLPLGDAMPNGSRTPAPEPWARDLSLPNIPVPLEQRTLDFVKFYRDSQRGRQLAEAWARKAGRYVPAIQAELARAGLPTDLVWMSLIESGHNPTIRSVAGAAGLWQFIPETARCYGLTVDRWVDERLDPLRSTQAAAIYLNDLKSRFGSWELAMAAYNMGHAGLSRSVRRYNTNDFWRLTRLEAALPWETALYVPKILAIAIVMKNRRAFGLGDVPMDPAISFDTIYVPGGVPLAEIALSAGLPVAALTSMNPHFLGTFTPPASRDDPAHLWPVHVPRGLGSKLSERPEEWQKRVVARGAYRVRLGDTLANVAERLRGTPEELAALNQLDTWERLIPGSSLLVPTSFGVVDSQGERLPPRDDEESVVVLPPLRFSYTDRERVFYRVLPGDTLEALATAFGVRPEELVLWNGLDERARLQSEMVLTVFVRRGAELGGVRFARERNAGKHLEAGSPTFLAHFQAEEGRQRLSISAREGDTLQAIGRRYGLSAGMMERINHRARNERLEEGTPVVVYAKYGPVGSEQILSRAPDPLPPVDPPHPSALPSAPIAQ
ncbi:MAG TPA: LysM peptidoglycan-binding domain-containing protein [Polyangiaceae bacterium]|nr:LysM peptidoglycan-binding domain-containing protein [Polyangiaceae bacterium]